ncbi:HK97-gp10 family putative phage morphogenesis protein [Methanoculleus sp. UBA208]|uniref:HK97-gp10 family putative phage morphogenesis protein n=1 Tax=Methanoculleus sp. UBA208 TaxID=1915494 RepID=UPI002600FC02|nr:HK97-gp10 family putative phage morphogenesis protein [Methanoculleus sp. UBA208]
MATIEGLDRLTRKLHRLAECTPQPTLARHGEKNMLRVERVAKQRCPVGKSRPGYTGGRLRNSIGTQAVEADDGVEIRTGTNVDYGPFVEYGTGRRGAEAGVDHPDDYNYGPKPGTAPRPFLRPAWDEEKVNVVQGLAKDLQKTVREAVR